MCVRADPGGFKGRCIRLGPIGYIEKPERVHRKGPPSVRSNPVARFFHKLRTGKSHSTQLHRGILDTLATVVHETQPDPTSSLPSMDRRDLQFSLVVPFTLQNTRPRSSTKLESCVLFLRSRSLGKLDSGVQKGKRERESLA